MMRRTTTAIVSGLLAAGSIFIGWSGEATVRGQQPTVVKAPAVSAPDATEVNNAAAQRKLAKYVAAEFSEAPLSDVLDYLADQAEVETYLNARALQEAAIPADAPVSIQLKKVRVDMLLDLALQQVGNGAVDYVIRDGIVVVTSVESLDGATEVKAYPVSDLLRLPEERRGAPEEGGAPMAAPPPPPGGFRPAGVYVRNMPANVEQLTGVITSMVAPDTWQDNGGIGTITHYGDMLIIRQNARTHREVEKVLKLLRDTAMKK